MPDIKTFLSDCAHAVQKYSYTQAYHQTFSLIAADTAELKAEAYRLRYRVYCDEYDFHEPFEMGGQQEKDRYDERARHFLLQHKPSRDIIGTLRVVIPSEEDDPFDLSLTHFCDHPLLQQSESRRHICEISRFCMDPRFRRRPGDGRFLSSYNTQDNIRLQDRLIRRVIPYPQAALLFGAFETALKARILNCAMLLEPRHLPSFARLGIPYRILGPHVGHYGGMQPLIFNIKHALDAMRKQDPYCYDIVSDQGRLQVMADILSREDWQDHLIDQHCRDLIMTKCGLDAVRDES